MGKKKKKETENPLWERLDVLEKASKKMGWIYGEVKKKSSKKKPPKLSEDGKYRLRLMYFQFHLYEIILKINGIDMSYYFVDSGSRVDLVNNPKLDETFIKLSNLGWGTPSAIDGLQFRGKFVTNLLFKVVRRTDRIITSLVKRYFDRDWDSVPKKKKYKYRNEVLEQWIIIVDQLVLGLLSSNIDYVPLLINLERVLIMADGANDAILRHLHETEELLAKKDEAGLEVNNITKMAFALATHSLSLKNCPDYDENLSYKDNRGVLNQVGTLGYAILKRRKKGDAVPMLYDCFQKADPEIISRFYEINEEAPEITVGLKALAFSSMFYSEPARETISRLM